MALAASALDANVVGVQDLPTLGLRAEEFTVSPGSPIVGMSLQDLALAHPDVLVVGIRRENAIARWHEIPGPITDGDVIVVLGEPSAMARVAPTVMPRRLGRTSRASISRTRFADAFLRGER